MHIAVQENHDECVNAILNSGNDIDLCILNDNGYAALHLACMNKNLRVVKMLDARALKTKQTIFDDIEAKHGNNALHIAIEARAVDIVDY
ncbi:MAG: ankyrin repeat domain-containing protein, partial [Sphingobacteriaceae bacterium]